MKTIRRAAIAVIAAFALVLGFAAPATADGAVEAGGLVIFADTAEPAEHAEVRLWHEHVDTWGEGEEDRYWDYASVQTGKTGRYAFELEPGTEYAVEIIAPWMSNHRGGFLGGGTRPENAETFTVEQLAGADFPVFELTPKVTGSVTGTITQGGEPLDDFNIEIYRWESEQSYWASSDWAWGSDGVFTREDLEVGTYTFRFDDRVYYGGGTVLPETPTEENSVEVLEGEQTALSFDLPAPGTVSGTVRESAEPASNVSVAAHVWRSVECSDWDEDLQEEVPYDCGWWEQTANAYTDENGAYELSLEGGVYAVSFEGFFYGGTGRTAPDHESLDESNSIAIDAGASVALDFDLPTLSSVAGTVTGPKGALSDATVQLYRWYEDEEPEGGEGYWNFVTETWSNADGQYTVRRVEDGVYTLRVTRPRHAVGFYGGGAAFGDAPTAANSFEVSSGSLTGKDVELQRRPSTFGKVAGQKLDYCEDNELYPNDDNSAWAVDIPFNLKYFGNEYSELFVNNNGNVTFDGELSQFTPDALDGGQTKPIIAPFFADVDTRDEEESDIVTYGASPDGNRFCVNWIDVEPYNGTEATGKFNSFQLLLTKREGTAGRVAGDFDITFNYDQIQWDTGSASDVPAVAGYASGSGASGTYFQLPGSMEPGALLDDGANALVTGGQGSSQAGRYVYQVRNDGHASTLGSLSGQVLLPNGTPAEGVYIEAVGNRSYYTTTDGDGMYRLSGVTAGTYTVRAWPNSDGLIQAAASATVSTGEATEVPDIRFRQPRLLPGGVGLSSGSFGDANTGEVPTVTPWEPLTLSYDGAAGGTASYRVLGLDGAVIRSGAMQEQSAGRYRATIPDLEGATSSATIEITFTPKNGAPEKIEFDVYIDPSGTVVDEWGFPVSGATATLLRSEDPDAEFEAVPDGSEIMSERNRKNPDTTDAKGIFGWDVTAAYYKVRVEKGGYGSLETEIMEVPPERLDLVLQLPGGTAPELVSKISGTPLVGSKLTASVPAGIDAGFDVSYRWYRGGSLIETATAPSYTLGKADAGKRVSAEVIVKRKDTPRDPLHPTEDVVEFDEIVAVAPATATIAAPAVKPTVSGSAKAGGKLTAKVGSWKSGYKLAYQWTASGKAIRGATKSSYVVSPSYAGKKIGVTVTATRSGLKAQKTSSSTKTVGKAKAAVKLTAKAAGKGRATLTVKLSLPGTKAASTQAKVTVYDGKKVVKKNVAVKRGKATVKLSKLKKGKHSFKVSYAGSKAYVKASKTAKATVK